MNESKNLWQSVLEEMQATLPPIHFHTWFKNTSFISRDAVSVTVGVPNGFVKEWMEVKFTKAILASLQKREAAIKSVHYTTAATTPMPVSWRRRIARPIYRLASLIAGNTR